MGEIINLAQEREKRNLSQATQPQVNPFIKQLQDSMKSKDIALGLLQHKIDVFGEKRPVAYEPHVEDRFQDLEKSVSALNTISNAFNLFMGYLEEGFVQGNQSIQHMAVDLFNVKMFIGELEGLLIGKDVITKEELQEAISIAAEAKVKQMKEAKAKMEAMRNKDQSESHQCSKEQCDCSDEDK